MQRTDLRVQRVHSQHDIKNLQGRSVRLDILAVDEADRVYNIEVQRNDKGAADETGDAGQKNFLHSPWFFRCDPIVQNSKIRLDYTPESV